jgi:acid phosphatase (class A)
MRYRFIVGVAAVLATAGVYPAQSAPKTFEVLTPEQVDPSRLLPPPVADGSDRQKAELAEVERVYHSRSPERLAQAEWDDKHESVELFQSTLGPSFDLSKLPATAHLLAMEDNDQGLGATAAKRYFMRKRPWAIDPSLVACDYAPNAPTLTSYPSGHATLSYSMGYVLAALMPEKAQAILQRAQDYAYSRVVCGAHYPSDIEASHALGVELAMMMMENPKVHQAFEAARAELQAAGLTAR